MARILAALILVLAVAAPARADTKLIISGGGFSMFSGSGGLHRFHRDHGRHWRGGQDFGGVVLHRLPRNNRLLLSQRHEDWAWQPRKHRRWDHEQTHFRTRPFAPQVVIVVPGPFESRIKIVTVPGRPCFGTLHDRRTGRVSLVLLPSAKPQGLAWAD